MSGEHPKEEKARINSRFSGFQRGAIMVELIIPAQASKEEHIRKIAVIVFKKLRRGVDLYFFLSQVTEAAYV